MLSEFDLIEDRADRMQLLIDVADRFRDVPPEVARRPFPADHKTPACESEVYVWSTPRQDGTLDYWFAVENPQGIAARALAVVLRDTLSGAPLDEVARVPTDVVLRLFGQELSMGKSLGLMGMVVMVQREAKRRLAATAPRA
jgi:cysteine desulfuration protein SufE